jgi:hypothetical protein
MTATQIQFRRGSAAQMATFAGAQGEVVVDTTNNRVVVQDGATAGGFAAAKLNELSTFRNWFVNPACDVDQRGTRSSALAVTTSGARVLDGNTIVLPTGAGVTAGQAAAPSGTVSQNCLSITGAASVTDVIVRKRIESVDAAKMAGMTVTVQAKINQNTGSAVVPKLSVGHPSSVDSYSSIGAASLTNEVNAQGLQSCASGSTTAVAYTFALSANAVNGLEVNFDLGALVASQVAKITDFDIRVTPGAAAGLNYNPPLPELRPIAAELLLCQRHLYVIGTNGATNATVGEVGMAYGSGNVLAAVRFPASMRAAPSLTVSAASDFFALTSGAGNGGTFTSVSLGSFTTTDRAFMLFTGGSGYSAGNAAFLIASDANAKLTFSAEL